MSQRPVILRDQFSAGRALELLMYKNDRLVVEKALAAVDGRTVQEKVGNG